ncbi:MAG TPA: hypothetical protein VHF06_21065 [Pseudonocardiaceae bacterium]|nr:hypothetical protein [Pseudonocardiaceae bacterium]
MILALPENDWKGVVEMARFVVERMITRNIAAVGVVGSMTFCVMEPECEILVVPSPVGDSVGGGRWG